jgi:uncharacterized RDD family membrane protein YckC
MHINTRPAALLRRIAAIVYDSLLLLAVLFVAASPFVIITGGSRQGMLVHLLFQIYLLAVSFIFFAWFWIHGGQTLGMRAWRLQIVREDGGKLGWRDAALRFFSAMLSWLCFGLGFLWILIDKERLAWHDRLSRTRVILIKPEISSKA